MSYLVTYYPNKDVIIKLRAYRKSMDRHISGSNLIADTESHAQKCFEDLISSLKDDIQINRYSSVFDVKSLSEAEDKPDFEHFLKQEINIVAQTIEGSNQRSEAIVYKTLFYLGENDNIHRISDIISVISANHYNHMKNIRETRSKNSTEKQRIKRKIRASIEYITAGTAVIIVNNTFLVGPLQIPSSTLGASAIMRGIADIRGV